MTFALYLTGVPGVGKSTIARALESTTDAVRLSYGEILTKNLRDRVASQAELRTRSAEVISADDVRLADEYVARRLRAAAGRRNVVVDSHALTAESYGLRAVTYTSKELSDLPFTHVVCLVAPADVIHRRVGVRADGRRVQDRHDLGMHASLQASLALTYSSVLEAPVAFVRSDRAESDVLRDVADFVGAFS